MLIGGGVASTAGGIRLLRLLLLFSLLRWLVARASMPPDAVIRPRLGGSRLEPGEVMPALLTILLFALLVARYLADFGEGHSHADLGTMIKGDAHLLSFVARSEDAGPLERLALPREARIVCVYRDGKFLRPDSDLRLQMDDEVVLLTHTRHLASLREQLALRGVQEA